MENRSESIAEDPAAAGLRILPAAAPAPAAGAAATEPTDAERAIAAERARCEGILQAARIARVTQAFADGLIREGVTLEVAQSRIFRELEARQNQGAGPQPGPARIEVGVDPLVHVRAGIEGALLHRVAPQYFPLTDQAREYRGMSLLDTGRAFLTARGIRVTGMPKMELAAACLGLPTRGGMHTTSDFPFLLADVANKTLRKAYEEAPQTFRVLGRLVTLPDFKPVYRNQMGDAPALLEVKQHGEYKRGTIGEARETYRLVTYGRVFAITRQALVNDDADAFGRVPAMFGRAARNLESDLVWEQITSNPAMGDGFNVFSAEHANFDASGDVISVASLGAGRAAMRQQRSIDGEILNIAPKYLIVGSLLETKADSIVAPITANNPESVNPFSGKLTVIAEPRLDADPLAWYLGGAVEQIEMLEFGYLEGEAGPQIETRVGFDVDGLEIKCREDFGTKVIDYRGLYKNAGDEES